MKHTDTGEHTMGKPLHAHQGHHHIHDEKCGHEETVSPGNPFTSDERKYMISRLSEHLGTQPEGIYHADTTAFKDDLKEEANLVRALIEKLAG